MANTQTYRKPASAVVTLPDPDQAWNSSHAEIGGTLEFRSESVNYPTFQVIFDEDNPSDKEKGHVFEGSIDRPLVIRLKKEGEFAYTVLYFDINGGPTEIIVRNATRVQPCPGCAPILNPPPKG